MKNFSKDDFRTVNWNVIGNFSKRNKCSCSNLMWNCLTCEHSGCGRSINRHAIKHYEVNFCFFEAYLKIYLNFLKNLLKDNKDHRLVISSSTWCYHCDVYHGSLDIVINQFQALSEGRLIQN